jgi:hypothetical protein
MAPLLPKLTPIEFSMCDYPMDDVYRVHPRTIEDFVISLQAPVTTVDASMLRRVCENDARHIAF